MQTAANAGSQALNSTMEYYSEIISPTTLTPDCSADLSQFASDLMKVSSGDEYMWAGRSK